MRVLVCVFLAIAAIYAAETAADPLFRHKRELDLWCQPGLSFKSDCNTCHCDSDGIGAMCTLKGCPSRDPGTADVVCTPRHTFEVNGHHCDCNEDGTKITCTKNSCL